MSHVNLLPPELRRRHASRRLTTQVVAAGLAVFTLIGVVYVAQGQRLADARAALQEQQVRNAELTSQIQALQQFADLQAQLSAMETLAASLYVNEVSWSSVLLDVSRVIPDASYLQNLTGQVTAGEGAIATGAPGTTLIGSMTFSGVAAGTETIASWISRLEQVQGWVNVWVSSAQESAPFSGIYSFSNGLDLTQEALTERGSGTVVP